MSREITVVTRYLEGEDGTRRQIGQTETDTPGAYVVLCSQIANLRQRFRSRLKPGCHGTI